MFHAGEIDYPTGDGGLQGEMLEPAVCPAEDGGLQRAEDYPAGDGGLQGEMLEPAVCPAEDGGLQRAEDYPAEDDRWVRSCKSPN